jgi:hypothetical protein
MDSICMSTMAHGERLLSSPAERAEFKKMAVRHKDRRRQLRKVASRRTR